MVVKRFQYFLIKTFYFAEVFTYKNLAVESYEYKQFQWEML